MRVVVEPVGLAAAPRSSRGRKCSVPRPERFHTLQYLSRSPASAACLLIETLWVSTPTRMEHVVLGSPKTLKIHYYGPIVFREGEDFLFA